MKMVKVVIVRPGQDPEITLIQATLESYQDVVGGYIEPVKLTRSGITLICDEDGRLAGKPLNRQVGTQIIAGTFFLIGTRGPNFVSLTDADAHELAQRFAPLIVL